MNKIATFAALAPFAVALAVGPVLAEDTVIIKKHGDSEMHHRHYSEGRTKKVVIKKDGMGNTTKKVIKSADD